MVGTSFEFLLEDEEIRFWMAIFKAFNLYLSAKVLWGSKIIDDDLLLKMGMIIKKIIKKGLRIEKKIFYY